jgi:hypothetical protein
MRVIDFFKDTLVAYVQFLLEKVPAAVLTLKIERILTEHEQDLLEAWYGYFRY